MDRITLEGIEVWARHGVLPHEAALGQRFLVDVVAEVDLAPAAASDALDDTVDYGALAAAVAAAATEPRAQLVETVAGRVARVALGHDPRIAAVEVTVHKPDAPVSVPLRDVAVTVRRARG